MQVAVELAGDIALEEADDVSLGPSFLHFALEVGGGLGVMCDADHDDAPQRAVGGAVTTAVESVTGALARRGRDGGGTAQMGPGRL